MMMKNILKAGLVSLVIAVSADANICTAKQIDAMKANNLSQKQIDKLCKTKKQDKKKQVKTKTKAKNSVKIKNQKTTKVKENQTSNRKGLYLGGNYGISWVNKTREKSYFLIDVLFPLKDNIQPKFDAGSYSSVLVGYQINSHIALDIERITYKNDLKEIDISGHIKETYDDYDGYIDTATYMLNINYIFGSYDMVAPYISFGLGQTNMDLKFTQNDGNNTITYDDNFASMSFAFGVDFYINDNISIGVQARKLGTVGKRLSVEYSDSEHGEDTIIDMDMDILAIGAKIKF